MRCVYSNKGRRGSVEIVERVATEPVVCCEGGKEGRWEVRPIEVMSKRNRGQSVKRRLSLVGKKEVVESRMYREGEEEIEKGKQSGVTVESEKQLGHKPSIIDLLYENDKDLIEDKHRNQFRYHEQKGKKSNFKFSDQILFTPPQGTKLEKIFDGHKMSLSDKTKNQFNFTKRDGKTEKQKPHALEKEKIAV